MVTSFVAGSLAFLAYAGCAGLVALRGKRTGPNILLAMAAAFTAVWAATLALWAAGVIDWIWAPAAARTLRDGCWFAVTIALLRQDNNQQGLWRRLALAASLFIAAEMAFALTGAAFDTGLGMSISFPAVEFAVSVFGLVLIENLMRNVPPARRWSLKLLAIGLGALFGYDIILRIPEFLGGSAPIMFLAAQPLVYLVALPLFIVTAVRNDSLRLHVHSSRGLIFHSATMVFAGILLQGTALAALYIRNFGGTPAIVVSIVLGFTSFLALIIAISSQSVRSQIRKFVNENFFSYKYDYRLEWKKFIESLSEYEHSNGPERVLRTLANLLDSPGGVLWVKREGWGQFIALTHWSLGEAFGPLADADPMLDSLRDRSTVYLELTNPQGTPEAGPWLERFPRAWLAVPLRFRDELVAIALLQKPRAARRLDWEDRNLVALTALQLGAHLVHEHTAQVLADTQHLTEFNKRVTFAVHDLKNTAGQLSLLVHNAERFGDDPGFRSDMMMTISHAVENLQTLIGKLRGEDQEASRPQTDVGRVEVVHVDVCELVEHLAARRRGAHIAIDRSGAGEPIYATLPQSGALESALEHVVANAVEASPAQGSVRLRVERMKDLVRVCVTDRGPGMSQEFIAQELFRPLRTTKKKGLGVGACQARSILRDLGGDIEVHSILGEGTTVTLLLPAAQDAHLLVTG